MCLLSYPPSCPFRLTAHTRLYTVDDVPANQLAIFETAFQACEMTVRISILFARLSVLFLYLRAFFPTGIDRTVSHRVIHLVIWLNVLYSVALILVVTTQCVPAGLPFGSTCINEWLLLVLSSVINIISDFAILIIPLVLVWSLQMSTRKRYAIWALFAFGALAPLASIARLAYQIPTANDPDKTVIYMVVALLAAAEQVVGIVVGCAPVVSSSAIRLVKGQPPASKTSDRQSEIKGFGTLSRKRRFSAAPDPFRITEFSRFGSQEHLELSSITVPDAVADGTRQIET